MPPASDEHEIIRAAARGDRQAFDRLVRAKRESVLRTAYQITGNPADAQDVAQAVFLKVWQGLSQYDPARSFDTWLYRVTVNAAIDTLRSRGGRPQLVPLDGPEEPAADSSGAGAEERIDSARLQQAFLHLAARLAPRQRAVFVLREIEGLPTDEIASILAVTESTVRNHLLQARRALREGLEREYPDLVPRAGKPVNPSDDEDDA